jgi:hypothetical protein
MKMKNRRNEKRGEIKYKKFTFQLKEDQGRSHREN